ncbi:MAG: relaxase domain-containing protein, partial [Promicromonosporaceae bacterium]|nr:relaxase domain-containing protein [Promicromonosporaceae bacterium]
MGDGDRPAIGDAANYFNHPGSPPGIWLGSGLDGLGIRSESVATKSEAKILFSYLRHPKTFRALGNLPSERPYVDKDGIEREALSGYDLTFRIPKSVSIEWALADDALQAAIEHWYDQSVTLTLSWIEDNVLSTRSGSGGVKADKTRGLVAIAYKHYESRDGDPHLHTHVAVANRVQRADDGKWLTIDGDPFHEMAVTASEVHENILLDLLRNNLGLSFIERDRPEAKNTRAVVADIEGVPTGLIAMFSKRRHALKQRAEELLVEWRASNTGEPTERQLAAIEHQAFLETRKPKDKVVASKSELRIRWRGQAAEVGVTPESLREATLGRASSAVGAESVLSSGVVMNRLARTLIESWQNHEIVAAHARTRAVRGGEVDVEQYYEDDELSEELVTQDAAVLVHARLSRFSATWTKGTARNEAERLTRLIPMREGEREALTSAVADRAIAMCVPVTTTRYRLPAGAENDARLAFGGAVGFDKPTTARFTSREVFDAEAFLNTLTTTPTDAAIPTELAAAVLTDVGVVGQLSDDQRAAALHITTTRASLAAVVGPAGAGKTRTMNAVRTAWEAGHGPGRVIGVAPSAVAAEELSAAVGIDTHTVAGLLVANTPEARAGRDEWRAKLGTTLTRTRDPATRAKTLRLLTKADAEEASVTLRPGSLVVVDEASMCSTHDLAAIGRLAAEAGAKVALIGDPAQLDAPEVGGMLGWLDRQGKAVHLSTLWRFIHPDGTRNVDEGAASLLLRDGDISAFAYPHVDEEDDLPEGARFYEEHGRVHEGLTDDVMDEAYEAARAAQRAGRTTILVAGTNEQVGELNLRTTLERREAGEVDASRTVPVRYDLNAGVGEVIVARDNNRQLRDTIGNPIYNGNTLIVTAINPDGSITAIREDARDVSITLPAWYAQVQCELGYAITAHRAQGITVDEAHVAIPYGARLTRELLYVAMTRGRYENHVWIGLPDEQEMSAEHRANWRLDREAVTLQVTAMRADGSVRVVQVARQTGELGKKFTLPAAIAGGLEGLKVGEGLDREKLGKAMARPRVGADGPGLPGEVIQARLDEWFGVMVDNRPTARNVIAKILAAQGADTTAHEQTEAATAEREHLGQLVAEHDLLASFAAAPGLIERLTDSWGPQIVEQMTSSVAWNALVTVYRRAYATHAERADRLICRVPLTRDPDPLQDALEGLGHDEGDPHLVALAHAHATALTAVDKLTAPGAHHDAIKTAEHAAELAEQASVNAETLAAEQEDGGLPLTLADGTPLTPRRLARLRANSAAAQTHLATVRDPAHHAAQVTEALTELDDVDHALRNAAPDPAKIAHTRLRDALDAPAPCRIDDPAWLAGLVVPVGPWRWQGATTVDAVRV